MARVEGGAVIIETDWPGLKNQIDTRSINFKYEENTTAYEIFAVDGQYFYKTTIYKSGQAPQDQATYDTWRAEFEASYKDRITDFNSTQPFYISNIDGYSIVLKDGAVPTSNDGYGIAIIGSDGSNYRLLKTDTSGRPVFVGAGSAGSPAGGVISIQGVPSGTAMPVSISIGTSDTTASGTLNSLNATVSISLTGTAGMGFQLAAGTLIGTIIPEISYDGGTTWVSSYFSDITTGTKVSFITFSSNNTATARTIITPGGSSNVRVRVSAYTSGTASISLRATTQTYPTLLYVGSNAGILPPNVAQMGGSDGYNLRPIFMDTSGRSIIVGAAAQSTPATGNPLRVGGWDNTNIKTLLTDNTGQLKVIVQSPSATIALTLSYDDSVAVAGAQAGYYYSGLVYTVPNGYSFVCSQFNSSSTDNRVTARVSKFIVGGTYDVGANLFTSGSSYSSPSFSSYMEAEVTTVIGGTNDFTLTATYTNQDGTSSRTATALVKKNTPVGYKIIFTLQTGDYGVRSVQNITRSTANTGVVSIKLGVEFYFQAMTTASLNYITVPSIQTMRAAAGEFIEIAWSSNAAGTAERIIKVAGGLEVA